jgi:hypothetical protein
VEKILVPSDDHSFEWYYIIEETVVLDKKSGMYFEYAGQDLEEDETLVTRKVAR